MDWWGPEFRRLIPAHAGKTYSTSPWQCHSPAHPRSRGENVGATPSAVALPGSSPLTRGKLGFGGLFPSRRGLIPAHAGKTFTFERTSAGETAHPRSRGENPHAFSTASSTSGSSPLTRGKRSGSLMTVQMTGLIPAHAGKTAGLLGSDAGTSAHPRSRGENHRRRISHDSPPGSSPLTRGKREIERIAEALGRLIPAHAGKTVPRQSHGTARAAHPRSRGENSASGIESDVRYGSSPLTRGKPRPPDQRRVRRGLIPAHAGKTPRRSNSTSSSWAHPRSRGENRTASGGRRGAPGSSPLTRGKLKLTTYSLATRGLIPAHAGKT